LSVTTVGAIEGLEFSIDRVVDVLDPVVDVPVPLELPGCAEFETLPEELIIIEEDVDWVWSGENTSKAPAAPTTRMTNATPTRPALPRPFFILLLK
jgi:hypothetical protein